MGKLKLSIVVLFFFMFLSISSAYKSKKKQYKPCHNLALYFHDILYDGQNFENATAAIVGARKDANLTVLADHLYYGDVVVFDDPITVDNNLHSPPVGRAQGMYVYNGKSIFSAWLGFSFVLNTTDYQGIINFVGANPFTKKTRDISVVGGTEDFFMHRGVATLMTDAMEQGKYFRLHVDIKFYECW